MRRFQRQPCRPEPRPSNPAFISPVIYGCNPPLGTPLTRFLGSGQFWRTGVLRIGDNVFAEPDARLAVIKKFNTSCLQAPDRRFRNSGSPRQVTGGPIEQRTCRPQLLGCNLHLIDFLLTCRKWW